MPRKQDIPKRAHAAWEAIAQGAPELLDDTDFSHPYVAPKPRAPVNQTEKTEVQRPLIIYLRRHLPAGSVVFAVPNGARSKNQIFALMRDGMLPGAPDICVCVNGAALVEPRTQAWVGFIECKRPNGGSLSDAQRHVQGEIKNLGLSVLEECRSVEQAVAWLHQQGVPVR